MLSGVIGAFGFGTDAKTSSNPITSATEKGDFARLLENNDRKDAVVLQEAATSKTEKTAIEKFMAYQDMSPAEKIRASYLAQHGMTEEDVAAMSPEERQKIEDEILEDIRKSLEASTGQPVSTS